MGDTGDVRRANRGHVRRVLWRGGARTKEEIAREAGISLPTANTLLNEMARSGEVVSSKAPNGRAGRTALAYRANEQHGPVLELSFEVVASGKRVWRAEVVGVLGTVLRAREGASEQLSCEALLDAARSVLDGGLDVRQVVLGVPAIVCEGRLRHCDAPELDGAPLVDVLAQGSGLPVHAENDMHHKAYGCYRELGVDAETVTLANFPARVLPGTATVADGRVLRGAHRFAGMIGFIDYGEGSSPRVCARSSPCSTRGLSSARGTWLTRGSSLRSNTSALSVYLKSTSRTLPTGSRLTICTGRGCSPARSTRAWRAGRARRSGDEKPGVTAGRAVFGRLRKEAIWPR